jgi:regulatory Fis family protein
MDVVNVSPNPLRSLARGALDACDAVLVRVWTVGPGDSCATCVMRPECPDQSACLHLVLSLGATTTIEGPFRRFPIGARRMGRVFTERMPYVERGELAARGLATPGWIALHAVRSFAAVPLGGGRGVLALFSRRLLTEAEVGLLALAARAAAPSPAEALATRGTARYRAGPDDAAAAAGHGALAVGERRTLAEIQREAIERVLAQTGGRVSGPRGAASVLGLKPSTLASRMQKLGVRRPPRGSMR